MLGEILFSVRVDVLQENSRKGRKARKAEGRKVISRRRGDRGVKTGRKDLDLNRCAAAPLRETPVELPCGTQRDAGTIGAQKLSLNDTP